MGVCPVCLHPELGFKGGITVPAQTSITKVAKRDEEYKEG